MKNTLRLFRFIFLSIIWVLIYFSFVKVFFIHFWNFDFYHPYDWNYLISQWQGGWVIDSLSELAFFICAFAVLPFFLLGWFCFIRFKWFTVFVKPFKSLKERARIRKRLAIDAFPSPEILAKELLSKHKEKKATFRKFPLRTKLDLSKQEENKVQDFSQDKGEEIALRPEVTSSKPVELSEPKYISRIDVKYEVLQLTEQYGLRLVQDLKIGNNLIDFAILVKGFVYLINLEPIGNEWIADETGFEDDEPLWFSETKYEVSPVYRLEQATKLFSSVLEDVMPAEHLPIEVKQVLLIGSGNILNYADINGVWEEKGVLVYRLSNGLPEGIANFSEFISNLSSLGSNSPEAVEMIYTAFVAVEP